MHIVHGGRVQRGFMGCLCLRSVRCLSGTEEAELAESQQERAHHCTEIVHSYRCAPGEQQHTNDQKSENRSIVGIRVAWRRSIMVLHSNWSRQTLASRASAATVTRAAIPKASDSARRAIAKATRTAIVRARAIVTIQHKET